MTADRTGPLRRARPRPAGAASTRAVLALAVLATAALLAPAPATAQPRPFRCVGAERLEDDVFAVPFARDAAIPGEGARATLDAAAALARAAPERLICVLGHAGAQEGGARAGSQLAARRARAVADALSRRGVERDRVRAEARRAAFSPARVAVPMERSVTIVVLPEG